jgi:hypothetical protein
MAAMIGAPEGMIGTPEFSPQLRHEVGRAADGV